MSAFLTRFLRLQPEEVSLVMTLTLLLTSNALAAQVSDVIAVSGFLNTVGVNQILWVWVIDMLLTFVITAAQSLIIDRFQRVDLMGWMCFGYAFLLLVLRILFSIHAPGWLNFSFLYLLAEQQSLFFPLVFWLLASDIFSMAQSKRLFPVIATGTFIGEILGLGTAAIAPLILQTMGLKPEELLNVIMMIYMLAFVLIQAKLRSIKLRPASTKPETAIAALTEGWQFVKEVPSFRYLTQALITVNICLTVFEFHFLVVSDQAFNDVDRYQQFYSLFRLASILLAFTIQGVFTSRVIDTVQLKNSFFALPIAQFFGTLCMMVPGLVGGVSGFSISKLTHLTIDESARKAFQALVPEERRGRVSIFMDSYLYTFGTLIGCILTGAIVLIGTHLQSTRYFYVYLAVALLAVLLSTWSTFRMRQVYDMSLFNWRLKRRQRGKSVLDKLDF